VRRRREDPPLPRDEASALMALIMTMDATLERSKRCFARNGTAKKLTADERARLLRDIGELRREIRAFLELLRSRVAA
jgi:hypothetical protein